MTVATITGGRDRTPTLLELDQLAAVVKARGVSTIRHGDCRGTDRSVAAWVKVRQLADIEAWPAEDYGAWPECGPLRNRAMLDGGPRPVDRPDHSPLLGRSDVLIRFRGGPGTTNCTRAALERRIPVEFIDFVSEPRPWNRHHGSPPGPASLHLYVGRGTPLGNPYPADCEPGETRQEAAIRVLKSYRRWLWGCIQAGDRDVLEALDGITDAHHLVCSCWPSRCHVEVIVAAWRWRRSSLKPERRVV